VAVYLVLYADGHAFIAAETKSEHAQTSASNSKKRHRVMPVTKKLPCLSYQSGSINERGSSCVAGRALCNAARDMSIRFSSSEQAQSVVLWRAVNPYAHDFPGHANSTKEGFFIE